MHPAAVEAAIHSRHTAARWSLLRHTAARWSLLRYTAVRWSLLRHTAARWSLLRHTAVRWSLLRHTTARWSLLRHTAVRWSLLRHTAVRWSLLRHYAAAASLDHRTPGRESVRKIMTQKIRGRYKMLQGRDFYFLLIGESKKNPALICNHDTSTPFDCVVKSEYTSCFLHVVMLLIWTGRGTRARPDQV